MVRSGCEGLLVQDVVHGKSGDLGAAHMGNADGMGGCVRPSTWGPRGRQSRELRRAERPHVHAPILRALQPLYVEPETIKVEAIFIDGSVTNTKVASMFTKLKHAITVLNKAL